MVDDAVNADVFEAFVGQVLTPTLRPGDIVVMDNLSSHKRRRTRELIESARASVWYLPPYSPDLNPIENVFSKVKQHLRSLACRSREALWATMQSALICVTRSGKFRLKWGTGYRHADYPIRPAYVSLH